MGARALSIILLLTGTQALAGTAPSCDRLWNETALLATPNHNAGIRAEEYLFEHTRGLNEYGFFLGSSFYAHAKALPPGARTLDLGGGLGLAHLQLSQQRGTVSTVVNLQDFPALWTTARQRLEAEGTSAIRIGHLHTGKEPFPDTYWVESVGGLLRSDVANVGNAFFHELPRALEKPRTVKSFSLEEVRDSALEIIGDFETAAASKNWRYVTESVENVLPRMRGSNDLITDVFGAFYYSPGRVELLRQAEGALKPGGTAYFSIVGFLERGISDRVRTRDGSEMDLFEYLLLRHPHAFRIEGETRPDRLKNQPAVLIMSKGERPLELRLRESAELEPYQNGNMIVPRRLYSED